jgi:hypothetical protein
MKSRTKMRMVTGEIRNKTRQDRTGQDIIIIAQVYSNLRSVNAVLKEAGGRRLRLKLRNGNIEGATGATADETSHVSLGIERLHLHVPSTKQHVSQDHGCSEDLH